MLENTIRSLRSIKSRGAVASRATANPENLRLEVEGGGTIRSPISATMARKPRRVARPAR